MQNRNTESPMFVYLVSVTELTLPVRSYVSGIYATNELAEDAATNIRTNLLDVDIRVTVTETEVIGFEEQPVKPDMGNGWVNQVDRQGGSFDDREILNSYTWR